MAELTYLDMQSRIARELRRSDLGREITDAIQDAIRHYKDERFPENVSQITWTAVANQRAYPLPKDFSTQVHVFATWAASGTEPLKERPLEVLDYLDQNGSQTSNGVAPCYYSLWGTDLLIYPRFAATSTTDSVTCKYISNLAPPDLDDDKGFWMNEAERLIRCHAKHTIFGDVLYVPDQSEYQLKLADAEFQRIVELGFARALPTQIIPTDMM